MTTDAKRVIEVQQLSAGDLKPLTILIDHLVLAPHFPGDVMLNGADLVIRSPHPPRRDVRDGSITDRHSGRRYLVCANRPAD